MFSLKTELKREWYKRCRYTISVFSVHNVYFIVQCSSTDVSLLGVGVTAQMNDTALVPELMFF